MANSSEHELSLPDRISTMLTNAGDTGLHVDDINKVIGNKNALAVLIELEKAKVVMRLPANKWKLSLYSEIAAAVPLPESYGAEKVDIHLPGQGTFSSYRNSLQEYCQKRKLTLPTYKNEMVGEMPTQVPGRNNRKLSGPWKSTVSFQILCVEGTVERNSDKDAVQQAAFDALKVLGYFPKDAVLDTQFLTAPIGSKRKEQEDPLGAPPTKMANITSFKSKLAELAQAARLPAPTYVTETAGNNIVTGGFVSTVTFNGNEYRGTAQSKKKMAEHTAAHMCLFQVNKVQEPPEGVSVTAKEKVDDVKGAISELRQQASKPTDPDVLINRLNEYCLREGIPKPSVQTSTRQDKAVVANIVVNTQTGNKRFVGDAFNDAKDARRSAARKACIHFQLAASAEE